jgi:hypothetical protein
MQSADAMTELLKHPSRDFPLGDVMAVIESVHFGGTKLNDHEVMHEMARIAQTATDPEIRERARLAIETIEANDPRRGSRRYDTKPPISDMLRRSPSGRIKQCS